MSSKKTRRSFEAGHFRKFLLIVDESMEVESALYFAASRIQRSSGSIVMLYVIVPQEFQHWINVRQQQVEEETAKAKALFRLFRRKLNLAGFEGVAVRLDPFLLRALLKSETSASSVETRGPASTGPTATAPLNQAFDYGLAVAVVEYDILDLP